MYKIFINDKPFIITETDIKDIRYKSCVRVSYDPLKTKQYIKDCESMRSKGYVLITDDIHFAYSDLCTHMVLIEAAGGTVFNDKEEILLIKRLGKWDLPKGKIDSGERQEDAAIREVMEECGIDGLAIINSLPNTYHVYKLHNFNFLKVTHWYRMHTASQKQLSPQQEEHISEAKWCDWKSLDINNLETYDAIRDLLLEVR